MPDALPRVIVIALLIACSGALVAVCWRYAQAWRRAPRDVGLTPLHVAAVSMVVLLDKSRIAFALLEGMREGRPVSSAGLWMYGTSCVLLLGALWIIGSPRLQRRVRFGRSTKVVVESVEATEVRTAPAAPRPVIRGAETKDR